jgi:hypothetical protein
MAFVALPVAMVLFTAVDFGMRAEYHNRLRSAAREGAVMAEYTPGLVSGCPTGIEDIDDRILGHDPELLELTNYGFRVVAYPSGVELPRVCDTDGAPVAPGTKIAIEVFADHPAASPLSKWVLPTRVTARAVVVVQG